MITRLLAWTIWASIVAIAALEAWMIGTAVAVSRACS